MFTCVRVGALCVYALCVCVHHCMRARRHASLRACFLAVLCFASLCFASLCFASLRFALFCFAVLCFASLRFVLLCRALLCFASLCFASLCFVFLCFALRRFALRCVALLASCRFMLQALRLAQDVQEINCLRAFWREALDGRLPRNPLPPIGWNSWNVPFESIAETPIPERSFNSQTHPRGTISVDEHGSRKTSPCLESFGNSFF